MRGDDVDQQNQEYLTEEYNDAVGANDASLISAKDDDESPTTAEHSEIVIPSNDVEEVEELATVPDATSPPGRVSDQSAEDQPHEHPEEAVEDRKTSNLMLSEPVNDPSSSGLPVKLDLQDSEQNFGLERQNEDLETSDKTEQSVVDDGAQSNDVAHIVNQDANQAQEQFTGESSLDHQTYHDEEEVSNDEELFSIPDGSYQEEAEAEVPDTLPSQAELEQPTTENLHANGQFRNESGYAEDPQDATNEPYEKTQPTPPATPVKTAPTKRKILEDDDEFDLLDSSTPEPKRTRSS